MALRRTLCKMCRGAFSPAISLDLQTNLIKPETRDAVPCSRKLKLDARAIRRSSFFSLLPSPSSSLSPFICLSFLRYKLHRPQSTCTSSQALLHYIARCFTRFHRFSDPSSYTRGLCSRCRCYGNLNWKFLCAYLPSLCPVITYGSNYFSRLSYIIFSFKCFFWSSKFMPCKYFFYDKLFNFYQF